MAPTMIAHRGHWWPFRSKQNTLPALLEALDAGYGIETDVRRSQNGMLVLAHDPEQVNGAIPLIEFLGKVKRGPEVLPLLFDIKEPEVVRELALTLERFFLLGQSYLFDFELVSAQVPEVFRLQCLQRRSDRYEPHIQYGPTKAGIWLDQFDSDWVTSTTLELEGPSNRNVFLVSSELHGRAIDLAKVRSWEKATGICTDIPHLFEQLFKDESPIHPTNPWWKV